MIHVIIYGLPNDINHSTVRNVHDQILSAISSEKDVYVDVNNIFISFPYDLRHNRPEKIIIVEIKGDKYKRGFTNRQQAIFSASVLGVLHVAFPKHVISCEV